MGKYSKELCSYKTSPNTYLPSIPTKEIKEENKQTKREKQSDQAGTDDLKEEKGKNTGKITNKMLNTDLDNIKDNPNNGLKKKI